MFQELHLFEFQENHNKSKRVLCNGINDITETHNLLVKVL